MSFQKGNQYGKQSKRGKDVISQEIKDKIKANVSELLDSLKIEVYTEDQKLRYLQVILPYIMPKQRAVTIDTEEDLPLFIQEPPQVVIFKTTEERELWDAASEEEKENLVEPYTFKDQVSKHFKD